MSVSACVCFDQGTCPYCIWHAESIKQERAVREAAERVAREFLTSEGVKPKDSDGYTIGRNRGTPRGA